MRPGPALKPEPELGGADLAWTALRYVLDELTATDAARFEATLLHDQAAREAVAAAVDQVGAVAIVARERVVAPVGSFSPRRIRLATLGAAAALLLAAWWGTGLLTRRDRAAVALAWSTIRDEADGATTDGPAPGGFDPGATEPAAPGDPLPADGPAAEVPAERPLPSWMVAAVAPAPEADEPATLEEN